MWLMFVLAVLAVVAGTILLHASLVKSAIAGAVVAFVLVFAINVASPGDCLQKSKGWRVLTAYKVC